MLGELEQLCHELMNAGPGVAIDESRVVAPLADIQRHGISEGSSVMGPNLGEIEALRVIAAIASADLGADGFVVDERGLGTKVQ
ncbi:hypothetical protein ACIA5D_02710 [Actinoplanes sp. NPDC051513]|uniref:hypothetical protein n=1 Tax=Actinoplanes sp. NPDC051513 TaxID=3363908 RepID=UPI0037A9E065